MSERRKIQFTQVAGIAIAWMVAAFLISCYDHFLIVSDEMGPLPSVYSFGINLTFNMLGALGGALLAGSLFVFYLNVKFIDKPYGYTILLNCITYMVMIIIIHIIIGFFWVPYSRGIRVGEPGFGQAYKRFALNPYHLKDILVWSIITALTQFVLLMNNKFGHGVLWAIIRGKYHLPREETRIFMFADLNDSTTIAERLGDNRYHDLLKDFFSDITDPVINNKGEIHQYIGDQVVVGWKFANGITGNRCIQCFFDMKRKIESRSSYYLGKYGLVPDFKAGIHFGKVVAGEIGILKRDITFSGDVLNTTSRIENKCREFEVNVIASDDLLSQLSFGDRFITKHLGNIRLRGKEKEVGLSTLLMR